MKRDNVMMAQFIITVGVFCTGLILGGTVGDASLAAMVWLLWLIYSK